MLLAALMSLSLALQAPIDEALADEKLRELTVDQGVPAAAIIAVSSSGETCIRVAGVKQLGSKTPALADDPWHIGSNHKAMTATLAMALVEDGHIRLDSTVPAVLGDTFRVHGGWDGVTLQMLLTHRSGVEPNPAPMKSLRYILFGRDGENGPSKDRKQALKDVLKKAPEKIPGKQYQYSNYGYTLAGEMLEAAMDKPYEVLLREELWQPLGMEGGIIGAPKGKGRDDFRGHRGVPIEVAPPAADNAHIMSPAGTFSYPLEAYSRFLVDQLRGQLADERALLSPQSYNTIATSPDDLADYGLGWGLRDNGWLQHSGSNTMWLVATVVAPDRDLAVSVLTNYGETEGLPAIIDELIASVLDPSN